MYGEGEVKTLLSKQRSRVIVVVRKARPSGELMLKKDQVSNVKMSEPQCTLLQSPDVPLAAQSGKARLWDRGEGRCWMIRDRRLL